MATSPNSSQTVARLLMSSVLGGTQDAGVLEEMHHHAFGKVPMSVSKDFGKTLDDTQREEPYWNRRVWGDLNWL
jgi:hypothetical protein